MKTATALILTIVATVTATQNARACGPYLAPDQLVLDALSADSSKSVVAFEMLASQEQDGIRVAKFHHSIFKSLARNREYYINADLKKDISALTEIQQAELRVRVARFELEKAQYRANLLKLELLIDRLSEAGGEAVAVGSHQLAAKSLVASDSLPTVSDR
ncbi:MAG: hypothetical protein N2C12_04710 [Planctomycetales bacterium]